MKLQHLAIIFVIIILPISLVVGEYIQMQINTIALQTSYSSKLQTATYDSIQAFRLNTVNNKYSTVSDSKVRDIEAAVSSYFTSLGNEIKVAGYATEELQEYTPAILYTLYDGYYIYSKYYNDTDKEYQYGLKPYVYYTCRYKKGEIDIIVNYTLDNYITIYGTIGENYITKSGNIINPDMVKDITWGSNGKLNTLKYGPTGKEVTIEREVLTEEVLYLDTDNTAHRNTYNYIIYNNNKVYYESEGTYFTINSNFKKQYINDKATLSELKQYTSDGKLYSDSALNYYYEAYLFSSWARQYLSGITQEHAVDEEGNQIQDFATDTGTEPIFAYKGDFDITDSCFDLNRISVIRRSIQTNLMTAIANYNRLSQKGYEYVLPVFSEEDWYKLTSNISVTSFLQGIPIGAKYFNDYCVISNNVNKEVVTLDSLYAITEDGEVHLINCKSILDESIKVRKVYKNIDFERQSVVITEGNERYYYPHYETRCYDCLVNVAETYDIDYLSGVVKEYNKQTEKYQEKTSINLNTLYYLRKEVLQAYGRECYDLYRVNEYFKGYDETISTDSITREETENLEIDVRWNESTHKAIVKVNKRAGVEDTLKIQYLRNPTNLQISDDTNWITVGEGNLPEEFDLHDKVYLRLYDGTYDGDYVIKIIKDTESPEETKVEVVEGTLGNNGYYISDTVKVKITAGRDKESGVDKLEYSLSGDTNVTNVITSNQAIESVNNGITQITAKTFDRAGNYSTTIPYIIEIKKDSLAPYEPTIELIGDIGNNSYYNSNLTIKFIHGKDREQPNPSGIENLHYEIVTDTTQSGTAYDGEQIIVNYQGGIVIRAWMEDNAGNKSAVVTKSINRDVTAPSIIELSASDITTKSFRLNINVKDEVSGIDKIIWYYKKSNESTYKTITTNCAGEKTQISKYVDVTNLTSGVYNAYAIVYDKAGNKVQTGVINVTTKNVETAEGATVSPTIWTNQNVTVELPTKTGYTTQYQIGNSVNINATWTNYTGPLTITKNTRVYYRYNDGVNKGDYGNPLTIANIDKLAPGATTVNLGDGVKNDETWKNNYYITFSATDAAATTDYGQSGISHYERDSDGDGESNGNVRSPFTPWSGYDSKVNRFRAVDYAGNKGPWTTQYHIHMDTESPGEVTVTYTKGEDACRWQNSYSIELSCSDNVGIAYFQRDIDNDGNPDGNVTSPFKAWHGYSSCDNRFRAVDYAGNVGPWTTQKYHIHMDTQIPTINTDISSKVGDKEFTLTLSATDTLSGMGIVIWYYKPSTETKYSPKTTEATGATKEESKAVTITNATADTYYAYAEVYDNAGNKATTSTIKIALHTHTGECYHSHDDDCYEWENGGYCYCWAHNGSWQGAGHCNYAIEQGYSVSWHKIKKGLICELSITEPTCGY